MATVAVLCACSVADPDPVAYRQACDAGDAKSCRTLAFWHETGFFGVTQDLAGALNLYERACDGGEAAGCYAVATRYESGDGVSQDLTRAAGLYERACEGGDAAGCYGLAAMYASGEGVPQDLAHAARLYERACTGGEMGCTNDSMAGGPPAPIQDMPIRHTPYTAAPYVLNREEVTRAGAREYPEHLRQAGVKGTAFVYFYIDQSGAVRDARIDRSSGNAELDQAALRVAKVFKFGAAYYRINKVAVWVSLPITFGVP